MDAGVILQTLTLAAVCAVAGYLFRVEHRLTRIETRLCKGTSHE